MPKSAVLETYAYLGRSLGKSGAPRDDSAVGRRVRETIIPRKARATIVAQVRLVAERGLAAGALAEVSLRLDDHRFIITAPGIWAAAAGEDDLRIGAIQEARSLGQEELPPHAAWHRSLYAAGAAAAVLLSQPPAALVAATQRLTPPPELLPDAAADIGPLALFETVNPDGPLPEDAIAGRRALLLPGYGLLSWGDDLPQAIARAEMIDRWCDVMLRLRIFNER